MPAVPKWSAPIQFDLTNPHNGSMSFNVQLADRIYLLEQDGCDFQITVRSTTDNVPQSDGSNPHRRFLTGVTMPLTISLWRDVENPACDELLVDMVDELSGALRSLLNAGDNEGRLAWEIDEGAARMLDDVRLSVYPAYRVDNPAGAFVVVLDSKFPYAQDLVQTTTECADGVPETIVNTGSAAYFPVFLVNQIGGVVSGAAVSSFMITVTQGTNVTQFVYNDGFPGAVPISAGGHYAEINCFENTIYLDGDSTNLKAGVDELNSEYPLFPTGTFDVQIDGCDMDVLWAPAWA